MNIMVVLFCSAVCRCRRFCLSCVVLPFAVRRCKNGFVAAVRDRNDEERSILLYTSDSADDESIDVSDWSQRLL